jgi:adenosylmethionine-8-amino-7-oxononanoate aminotransferase
VLNETKQITNFIATRTAFGDWSVPQPEIDYGDGPWLQDTGGKRYLDFACGSGALIFGHGDRMAVAAITEQALRVSLYPGQAFHSSVLDEYLTSLVELAGGQFSRALIASSGTDAVEAACKLALQRFQVLGDTGRTKIIGRSGSYHGNSLFTLSIGGHLRRRAPYEPSMLRAARTAAAFCYRCQYDNVPDSCDVQCANSIEQMFLQAGPESVAALILEPVVGATLSVAIPDARYLSQAREICDRYGALLIFDEVMTGFARTGRAFAWQHWGVQPDIMVLGKAISAGYFPMSAIVTTEAVAEPLRSASQYFENGQTFLYSPVAAAVGAYVVRRIGAESLAQRAEKIGEALLARLENLRRFEEIGDVRGLGLMAGIELVADRGSKDTFDPQERIAARFAAAALRAGLVVYPCVGGPESKRGDHVLMLPPLTITEAEIDYAAECLWQAASEIAHQRGTC